MLSLDQRTKTIAFILAIAVFVVCVSPLIDLDPSTLRTAGLLPACLGIVYRVPSPVLHAAPHLEQVVFRPARLLTDITCVRIC